VRKNIRIENPLSGSGFTSRNRAKRFVKHGLAEWVEFGISIRFIRNPRDHRDQSARQNVAAAPYWYERAAHEGIAKAAELANTPVVAPGVLLGLGKRKGASRHTFLAAKGIA
jgi:murein DD-endopeptidase MepM/ murein hydrolase activator NlpD